MENQPKNPLAYQEPINSSNFQLSNNQIPSNLYQSELDPVQSLNFKPNIDFYDNSYLPDYLNNEDQPIFGHFNFDDIPLKEEHSYVNSFLPQELIGVYSNQHPEKSEDNEKDLPMLSEECEKKEGLSNLDFNLFAEDEQVLLDKEDEFRVKYL